MTVPLADHTIPAWSAGSWLEPAVADLTGRVTDLDAKVTVLQGDMADIRLMLARMEERLSAMLPHLATKADLAEKPSKTYMWASWRRC